MGFSISLPRRAGLGRSHRRHLLQYRAEAHAALADKRSRFRDRAFVGVGAGKADADLVAAEHRPLAHAWRVLVIDELALPPAVHTGVGADIIEERVATVDPAVVQHHDAGIAAIDTIKHPNVNGIEAVTDAALSDRSDGRRGLT